MIHNWVWEVPGHKPETLILFATNNWAIGYRVVWFGHHKIIMLYWRKPKLILFSGVMEVVRDGNGTLQIPKYIVNKFFYFEKIKRLLPNNVAISEDDFVFKNNIVRD